MKYSFFIFWRNWIPKFPIGCIRTFLKILYVAKIFKILNISELAKCSLKSFWMMLLVWAVISSYAGHAQKLVPRTSMSKQFLLTGWAHMKIIWAHFHYSQPGRVWLVTSQLGTGKSLTFSSVPPVTHILCPRLSFLSNVICLLSHIFKMCLSSYVPCLTALFIVSRPLSHVAHLYSLSPVCCPQFYISVPCLLSSVLCPLFNVSVPFLLYSVPSLMWSVSCLLSSFICPLTSKNCHSVPFSVAPLFLSIVLLFLDLFSSSLVLCHLSFKRARMQVFLSKINVYTFSPCSR